LVKRKHKRNSRTNNTSGSERNKEIRKESLQLRNEETHKAHKNLVLKTKVGPTYISVNFISIVLNSLENTIYVTSNKNKK